MNSRLKKAGAGVGVVTAAGLLAIQVVGGLEGLRLYAYRDVIGVLTACYGETKGIKPGMRFSKATCDNMLIDSLVEHEAGMRRCLKDPDRLPTEVYIANLSLAYNIGVGGFCKSTLVRRQNAGDIRGSCDEFRKFVYAGGKVVKGLQNRRETERNLCLKGAA